MKIAIVVPVLNASSEWEAFAPALIRNLEAAGLPRDSVLVIDSSSVDDTAALVQQSGFCLHTIPRHEFNHGGTRQLALTLKPDSDVFVYLTQDAILATNDAILTLVEAFDDPAVAAAYGRQVPKIDATHIEAHARLFNYPLKPSIRTLDSREELGFKSIFLSNSFSAYRETAMSSVGGFDPQVVFGEDTILVARLHLAGWKTAYVPDASVYHSHGYSVVQELRRYFDVGVLHSRERWLIENFGGASGEGGRFVRSELRYLLKRSPMQIPSAIFRTAVKLVGYRLGRMEQKLSLPVKRRLAMNKAFWKQG